MKNLNLYFENILKYDKFVNIYSKKKISRNVILHWGWIKIQPSNF